MRIPSNILALAAVAVAYVSPQNPANFADVEDRGLDIDLGNARRGLEIDLGNTRRGLDIDLGDARRRSEDTAGDKDPLSGLNGVVHGVTDTVNEILADLCDSIGGTQLTKTVCQTVSGSDIHVGVANPETGLADVTISGRGLLNGASITVPVGSLEAILKRLV